jgi:hypothetical protein
LILCYNEKVKYGKGLKMLSKYEQQAQDFLAKTNTILTIVYSRTGKHFPQDKYPRDIYICTLQRGSRKYTFDFGQSYNCSGKWWRYGKYENGISSKKYSDFPYSDWNKNKNYSAPSAYDILSCLDGHFDYGDLDNFAKDFGYTKPSQAIRAFEACKKQADELKMLFNDDELVELSEIN